VNAIRERNFPSRGVVQMDHFYGSGMIGQIHERKALLRVATAVEGETAIAFRPRPARLKRPRARCWHAWR
jgi:hypothetical protein